MMMVSLEDGFYQSDIYADNLIYTLDLFLYMLRCEIKGT